MYWSMRVHVYNKKKLKDLKRIFKDRSQCSWSLWFLFNLKVQLDTDVGWCIHWMKMMGTLSTNVCNKPKEINYFPTDQTEPLKGKIGASLVLSLILLTKKYTYMFNGSTGDLAWKMYLSTEE